VGGVPPASTALGTIVVVGGGCYGSYYVRQLRRARAAGKATWKRMLVVDRDPDCRVARELAASADANGGADDGIVVVVAAWPAFFAALLAAAAAAPERHLRDAIVPSPLMPHLLFEWVVSRARERWPAERVVLATPDALADVPWQKAGGDATRYVSYATWQCPINCVEPRKCPHTGGARDWSFHESLVAVQGGRAGARTAADGAIDTAMLRVTHRTYGVGMIDVADVIAADAMVATALPRTGRVRVATASHCHGAVGEIQWR